jgi:cell shape-determining protein MreD
MVYAGVTATLADIAVLSFLGGLWFDCLSANPLGSSVLPLYVTGLAIYNAREVILKEQPFAQFVLGLCASAAAPLLGLLLLFTVGDKPIVGWGTLWQWVLMSLGGAAVTPLLFVLFEWLHRTFAHRRISENSFRADREIRRGRV